MINSNAPYSGLANIMNMRDRNPNTQLAYVPNGYLNSVPTAPNPYTGIPQVNSPIAMNEGGMPSMQYPMQEEAGQLADRGRYGDTTLVHMTPGEVQGLASLGQLTINPDTGLPEAFNMKALIPMIAGIAGAAFLGPAIAPFLGLATSGAAAAGVGAGLGTFGGGLLSGQGFGEAALGGVTSGLMSFGIGSLLGGATPGLKEGATGVLSPDVINAGVADPFGEVLTTTAGKPLAGLSGLTGGIEPMATLEQAAALPTSSLTMTPDTLTTRYFTEKAIEPGKIGKLFGKETIPAGELTKEQFINLGGTPSDFGVMDIGKQKLSDPLTYAPLAMGAVTGAFNDPYEYEEQEARQPADSGFGDYRLVGGEVKRPVASQAELRERALEGGSQNYFNPYTYVRNVAEGGIVGLQQGGMATPQAPSAMSAMLAQPMQQQQPVPINIAVQPMQQQQQQQQPMPMPGMGQPQPQGIQPLPDQSIAFKKNMDMEEQLQKQKTASSLKGQSSLLGLIGGAGNYLQSQGIGYPTTTPSGSIPQTPAVNQGAQVNMGASGGFAQGGLLGYNAGGLLGYNEGGMPSQEQGYFEGQVVGNGDGQSDCVPFKVDSEEIDMAMLSPDEYVLAADVVSYIGDGSSNAGAAKLDQFMVDVRKQAHGSGKQIEGFQERGLANLVA
jgi:hypothetical protein